MSIERTQLFLNLPRFPRKDAVPVPALTLTYTGPGTVRVTVDDTGWQSEGQDGAESFAIPFASGLTLGALFALLTQHAGYGGDVLLGYAAVRAAALVDEVNRPLTALPFVLDIHADPAVYTTSFSVASNPLWLWATGMGQVIARTAARINVALAQMNLLKAATSFADYWGLFTGTRRGSRHASLAGGTVKVINGSLLVTGSVGAGMGWTAAGVGLFPGATLEVTIDAGHVSTGLLAAYLPEGVAGLGDDALPRLVLTAPWTGPTGTFATYHVAFGDEEDGHYTTRQLHELLRPRENNLALAALIAEDTGVMVDEVRDLRNDIFVVSGTPLRGYYLTGKRYNTATVEVVLRDMPTPAAVASARVNAAGGVRVYVRGTLRLGTLTAYGYTYRTRHLIARPVPAMQIGAGAIGQSKIGPP